MSPWKQKGQNQSAQWNFKEYTSDVTQTHQSTLSASPESLLTW